MEVEDVVVVAEAGRERGRSGRERGSSAFPVVIAVVLFAALSGYCAVRSQGFISGDACIHYFSARYAFAHPQNFVDVWSRPVVTALYAGPAFVAGRLGIRIVSIFVAAGCGLVAFRVARGQGLRYPALALFFTLGQPLLFLHSFSEMTELPFALLLGLSFLAWQEKRFWLAALLVSWTPLARPEGFGILAMVVVGLLLRRNWKQLLVLPLAVILWDVAGWILSDHRGPWWRWLKDNWPYAGESMYGRGNILAFVMLLPMIISPLLMPAMFIGLWQSFFKTRSTGQEDSQEGALRDELHLRLCIRLTAGLPLFVLVAHSLLYWLGKMASAGEPRYLIVVAPFWGVLAARGWEWMFGRFQLGNIVPWGAAAVLVPPILVNCIFPGVPIPFWHDWESARQLSVWYQTSPLRATHPKVTTSHPGIYYFLDVDPYRSPNVQAWGKATMRQCPTDTVLIWDPIFGSKNACEELTMQLDEIHRAGWIEVDVPVLVEPDDTIGAGRLPDSNPLRHWHVFVSPSSK